MRGGDRRHAADALANHRSTLELVEAPIAVQEPLVEETRRCVCCGAFRIEHRNAALWPCACPLFSPGELDAAPAPDVQGRAPLPTDRTTTETRQR